MTAGILDPGPQTAGAELNPDEQALLDRIDGNKSNNLAEVTAALVAAFLLYRVYMRRRLREALADQEPTPSNLMLAAGTVYSAFTPKIVQIFAPHLVTGYLIGIEEAHTGTVDPAYLNDIAEAYAMQLGEHLNEVSLDAAVQGYTRQVNRRVPARRAVQNVIEAYGVPNRTMNTLVNVWTGEDSKVLSGIPASSRRDARAAAIIDKALKQRAQAVGDTEAWAARGQAKQLVWMYAQQKGKIPEGATKIWETARDERVCPVCGPLHRSEVPLDEPFVTDAGKVWSPPLHPNCRCDTHLGISLDSFKPIFEEELVDKALGDDPYDRDRHGRFAAHEMRRAQAARAVQPQYDPDYESTADMIKRIKAERAKKAKDTPVTLKPISVGTKVSGVNLRQVSIGGKPKEVAVQPKETQIEGPQIKRPQVQVARMAVKIRLPEGLNNITVSGKGPSEASRWYPLTKPAMTISGTQDTDNDYYVIDEDQEWTDARGIERELGNYWDTFIGVEEEKYEVGLSDFPDYYLDDKLGRFDVPPEVFSNMLAWQVSGHPLADYVELYQYDPMNEHQMPLRISYRELSNYYGIEDHINENYPVVIISTLGSDDTVVDESKNQYTVHNPGNWVTAPVPSGSEWIKDIGVPAVFKFAEPHDLKDTRR